MKGRKPVPTQLKILHGNPGKRALPKNEPKPTPKAPGMPTTMSTEAKAEWRRVSAELDRIGMLTKVDRGSLATYCMAWSHLVEAQKGIQEHGAVILVPQFISADGTRVVVSPSKNPWLQVFKENAAIVRAFASEFGLTPSSRARISLPEPDDQDLAELLGPRRSSGTPS